MKKNIYSVFSLLGFMILFFEIAIKTIIKCAEKRNFHLWIELIGCVILWWVGYIMLPSGIAVMFLGKISQFNSVIGNLYNVLILLYIYAVGIIITRKLCDWKVNNLEKYSI